MSTYDQIPELEPFLPLLEAAESGNLPAGEVPAGPGVTISDPARSAIRAARDIDFLSLLPPAAQRQHESLKRARLNRLEVLNRWHSKRSR